MIWWLWPWPVLVWVPLAPAVRPARRPRRRAKVTREGNVIHLEVRQ